MIRCLLILLLLHNVCFANLVGDYVFRFDGFNQQPGTYIKAHGVTGTATNATWLSTWKAFETTDNDEHIVFGNPAGLQLGNVDQTIMIVFRPDSADNSYLYSSRDNSAGSLSAWWSGTSQRYYAMIDVSLQSNDVTSVLTLGEIHVLTYMYVPAESEVRYYLNGVADGVDTTLTDTPASATKDKSLGAKIGSTGFTPNGGIYCIVVYDRLLTPTEIRHNSEILKRWYRL